LESVKSKTISGRFGSQSSTDERQKKHSDEPADSPKYFIGERIIPTRYRYWLLFHWFFTRSKPAFNNEIDFVCF